MMMIVAAIVPDYILGVVTGSGIQGLLMLNAGFFMHPSDLPKPVGSIQLITSHTTSIQLKLCTRMNS
jgi:hypothetical protein